MIVKETPRGRRLGSSDENKLKKNIFPATKHVVSDTSIPTSQTLKVFPHKGFQNANDYKAASTTRSAYGSQMYSLSGTSAIIPVERYFYWNIFHFEFNFNFVQHQHTALKLHNDRNGIQ